METDPPILSWTICGNLQDLSSAPSSPCSARIKSPERKTPWFSYADRIRQPSVLLSTLLFLPTLSHLCAMGYVLSVCTISRIFTSRSEIAELSRISLLFEVGT